MRLLRFFAACATLVVTTATTMLRGAIIAPTPTSSVLRAADAFPSMEEIEQHFLDWCETHHIHFDTIEEQIHRLDIFADNHLKIWAHNLTPDVTYKLGHNQFSHLTLDEFAKQHLGVEVPAGWYQGWPTDVQLSFNTSVLPSSVDWVAAGAVTPVKDQGQCGSCWSFSTTGAIEGANFIKTGKLVSLSEQQLVDCDTVSDQGCNGGFMDDAFTYVKGNGLTTEAAYPYKAVQGTCQLSGKTLAIAVGAVKGFVDVPSGDENALQAAVAQQPVSVAIQANQIAFQFYTSGVLTGTCGKRLDHGVLAVGYGVDASTPYWKVKNSWGSGWGEGGYIRIQKGTDKCGIADAASYPVM